MDYSGAKQRIPSGYRGGVDEKSIADSLRPPHDQRISRDDRVVSKFAHAQFVAHLSNDMRYGRSGDLTITLTVPYEFKHLAQPLADAFGLPLSIDVQVWAPFSEAEAD